MENSIMSSYKVRKIVLTLWLLIAVMIVNGQEVVTTSNVNLRSGPSTTNQILTQIPQGTTIDLDNCQSDWCSVRISGHDGYIAKRYTMPASEYKSYRENTREQAHPSGKVKYYKNSKGNTVHVTIQCRKEQRQSVVMVYIVLVKADVEPVHIMVV